MEKLHDELLKKLVRNREAIEVSEEFDRLQNDRAKQLRYVYTIVERLKMFPDSRRCDSNAKSDQKAEDFRTRGNQYYAGRQYVKALEEYNRSICYAEPGSGHISLGYANRSAVFFQLKLYEECLASIRMAIDSTYPDHLMAKLKKRESECTIKKRKMPPKPTPFQIKLSHPANKKVPFIVDSLKWQYSEDLGRHVVTDRALHAGDIISIEQPFSTCLMPAYRYKRCSNCLLEKPELLFACPSCTQTMFCSKACEEEGRRNYHDIECPIIDSLFEVGTEGALIAIRTVVEAITCFETMANLRQFVAEIDVKTENVFTMDYGKVNSKRDLYLPVHTLVTNDDLLKRPIKFKKMFFAAILFHLFRNYTPIQRLLVADGDEEFFFDLIYHHLLTAMMNMHGLDVIDPFVGEIKNGSYGSGSFPFLSLCNHSCSPNSVRLPFGKLYVVLILRNIAEGGHIWDNYGTHHCIDGWQERQSKLRNQYQFDCKCDACVHDYPLYSELAAPKEVPDCRTQEDLMENVSKFKYDYALKGVQRFGRFLRDYSKHTPCTQLCRAEEYLKFCYHILANNVPLEIRFPSQKK